MNNEQVREYCMSKPGVCEGFPFNDTALVFKVADKMFALLDLSVDSNGISLKCEPELAVQLRDKYKGVNAAYHFNKKHWNSVELTGTIPSKTICDFIDHSYNLVFKSLTKKNRDLVESGHTFEFVINKRKDK